MSWEQLFTDRQLTALGEFLLAVRKLIYELEDWPKPWNEALIANLALVNERLADYSSRTCSWSNTRETIRNTFARFALPIVWDYAEVNPLSHTTGSFFGALEWVSLFNSHALKSVRLSDSSDIQSKSALWATGKYDVVLTDPPYYDAIPYSDLMDFFHVWLRRAAHNVSPEMDATFAEPLGPKWDRDKNDGELVDQPSRFDGDTNASRKNYEDGMARAFQACNDALSSDGRLVVVFANKHPSAWRDASLRPNSGRIHCGWLLADPDGDAQQGSWWCAPVVLGLAGLQEAGPRPSWLGQRRA